MNNLEIFEAAMCCESGLCGVNVDPELMRVATTINTLKKKGINVRRFNLSSSPKAFVMNRIVNKFINVNGTKSLPVVLLNGKIIKEGKYPTNEEFEKWLDIKLDHKDDKNNCNCSNNDCC